MIFTDPAFAPFLLVVFALWLVCRRSEWSQLGLLLAASLFFYGHRHHWHLLPLILAYAGVNWAVGRRLAATARPRLVLGLGVAFNLGVLAYFKYTPMLWGTLNDVRAALGWPPGPPAPEGWAIPFGISFYAFTGIAYMVDVYRRATDPERNLGRYALSVTFFPHLVAGPILRPEEYLTRLRPGRVPTAPEAPLEACLLLARGYFKKMVLADRIALAADPFFSHVADPSTAGVWALPYVYLYAWQIYFDFSGYTDIARGLGLWFGYRWPDNFDLPYLAGSVAEFWHRWHITLSRFLRDYLYIPLGGSRCGWWRTNLNLMVTMLLGGLWHGASWSFLIWGGLHGTLLVLHRVWQRCPLGGRLARRTGPLWRGLCVGLTFHLVALTWCFFRLTTPAQSWTCVCRCFTFEPARWLAGGAGDAGLWSLLVCYGLVSATAYRLARLRPEWAGGLVPRPLAHGFMWGLGVGLLLLGMLLSPGGEAPPFIYFQF
jgi:D-alanyl-lipoteichoic acid acyltransferase DltB (MBOAT superfamily)